MFREGFDRLCCDLSIFDRVGVKCYHSKIKMATKYIERLNGTARRECLNLNWFNSLEEVNELLENWYKTYNFDRPHSSLKYKTPAAFEKANQNLYFKMVPANGG